MINVLVTGSNGQLASCIKDCAKQYKELHFIYTDYQELDICNLKQVDKFFTTNQKIDYCINCAAYTAVDKAESDVEKAFEINAKGAKNLALVCDEQGAVLIHVSTDFVFDGDKTEPYIETDTPKPISVYGASKLKGEVEIQKTLKKHFIIRTSWLYSEHGTNFMKTMLRLAETRDEISVVSDQIGTPTYAGDLADVILKIISSKITNFGLGLFVTNMYAQDAYDCALRAVGIDAVIELFNGKVTKAIAKKAIRKIASRALGWVGAAWAAYEFGDCMGWY